MGAGNAKKRRAGKPGRARRRSSPGKGHGGGSRFFVVVVVEVGVGVGVFHERMEGTGEAAAAAGSPAGLQALAKQRYFYEYGIVHADCAPHERGEPARWYVLGFRALGGSATVVFSCCCRS